MSEQIPMPPEVASRNAETFYDMHRETAENLGKTALRFGAVMEGIKTLTKARDEEAIEKYGEDHGYLSQDELDGLNAQQALKDYKEVVDPLAQKHFQAQDSYNVVGERARADYYNNQEAYVTAAQQDAQKSGIDVRIGGAG